MVCLRKSEKCSLRVMRIYRKQANFYARKDISIKGPARANSYAKKLSTLAKGLTDIPIKDDISNAIVAGVIPVLSTLASICTCARTQSKIASVQQGPSADHVMRRCPTHWTVPHSANPWSCRATTCGVRRRKTEFPNADITATRLSMSARE